jgi:hypothetical protein
MHVWMFCFQIIFVSTPVIVVYENVIDLKRPRVV